MQNKNLTQCNKNTIIYVELPTKRYTYEFKTLIHR